MIEYINQTILNAWTLCPERVRRRWIEGEIIPPGIAARIGTGVHQGAEVNHRAKMISGKDEPESVVKDAARDGYVKSIQDGVFFPPDEASTAQKQIAEGVDSTVNLAGLYHKDLAPKIQPALTEKTIKMAADGLEIPFIGTVDVYTQDRWLPDLKTAARSWPEDRAHNAYQITLYNELVAHELGEYPAKLSIEVLVKTKTPKTQSIETSRKPGDFDVLVQRAKLMMQMIEAGFFPPADPSSWSCSPKYCGYYWTCPYIPAHKKIIPKKGGN